MKPTSEMTEQEAAYFINLKKAINESFMALSYLQQAQTLAPDEESEIRVSTCVQMIEDAITDIRHAVQHLTN